MAKPLFELKDVYFSYLGKFTALAGVNLAIEEGSKVTIIGPNGTGKSTLLAMLDGLIFPDKGSIEALGRPLSENTFNDEKFARFFRSKVGFVFQNPDIQLFCPTVKEDISFAPLNLGVSKETVKKRLKDLADIFNIEDLMERSPHRLSIGEKRKVAIASTLAVDPDIIILDEPTAGLDPLTTRHTVDMILKANKAGKTLITATHDLHIVDELSDTVHVLGFEKNIIRSGSPNEILSDYDFLKKNNLIHAHPHKHDGAIHAHPHLHLGRKSEHHGNDG